MPLSKADLEAIRNIVWNTDTAPAPAGSDPKNPKWLHVNVLRDTYSSVQTVKSLVTALAVQAPDVDESAIVAGVLAGLTPAAIAQAVNDALPDELARQVVDELNTRLEA